MKVTVAICTWNRASLLQRTLESLEKLKIPGDVGWRLIVVNNNSTDHTVEVVESFRNRLP